MVASFVSYVLRYNVSTAGPAMMADLGITEMHLGYMASAMSIGYAVFQLPGGMLTDAFGPRRTLTTLIAIWILLTLLTCIVPAGGGTSVAMTVSLLVVIRFLVGATFAPTFPLVGGTVPACRVPLSRRLECFGFALSMSLLPRRKNSSRQPCLRTWPARRKRFDGHRRTANSLAALGMVRQTGAHWGAVRPIGRPHRGKPERAGAAA